MANPTQQKTALARVILFVFIVGAFFILLLETAEKLNFIGDLTESAGRLVIWCWLLAIIVFAARRARLERPIVYAGIFCMTFVLLSLVLEVTEDITSLDAVPIIGHDSRVRHFVEKAVMACWTCGVLFWVFLLVRTLERGTVDLEDRVRERTCQLTTANRQLERNRFAMDTAAEGIFTVAPDGRILDANKTACERLEYTYEELLEMHIADIDPDYSREMWPDHWEHLRKAEHLVIETTHRTKSGRIFPVEVSVGFFNFGGTEYCCSFIRDISERKESADRLRAAHVELEQRVTSRTQALRQSEQRLQSVVAAAPVVITSINADHVIDLFDGQALESLGRAPGELLGKNYFEVWQDFPKLTAAARTAFSGQVPGPVTTELDGITLETRGSPVFSQNGQVTGVITVCVNVTERVRALARLRSTNERLETALANLKQAESQLVQRERLTALGQMASGIAHDLNNAISPVMSYCELLRADRIEPGKRAEVLDVIHQGMRHATDVVKQLQFFFQPTGDQGAYEGVDLDSTIRETVSLTRPKWHDEALQNGRKITVLHDLPALPLVHGSSVELKQLVTNLVFNAVDAMPGGGIITISASQRNNCVVLEVTDNGNGMTDYDRDRCFEPFFTNKSQGSGLGLSVCHGIVQRHRGSIEVESRVGEGTTFRVRLPIDDGQIATVQPALRSIEWHSRRILLIDDDDLVRESTKALLEAFGSHVDLATDGATGIKMLDNGDYDLAITDLGMIGMPGNEVVQAIKAHAPNVSVIVVSGWSSAEVARRFKGQTTPDHILEKPVSLRDLQSILASPKKCVDQQFDS